LRENIAAPFISMNPEGPKWSRDAQERSAPDFSHTLTGWGSFLLSSLARAEFIFGALGRL
jgi:hypothetical protein